LDLSNTISLFIAPSCSSPNTVGLIFNFISNSTTTNYTLHTYGFTANSSSKTLTFAMKGDSAATHYYWLLDSVSVNNTNASTNVLINGGFELGNLTGWIQFCATNASCGSTGNYGQLTTSPCYSGSYCYVDKCSSGFDYLIQSFNTVIGDYYLLSFYLRVFSSGGAYLVDVILT
jgi:hypothetical protein